MQPLASGAKLAAYHQRLRESHDFRMYVDVLSLDELLMGSARMLDGQANIAPDGVVRRTATMTLSDPAGALDFSDASAWSGTSVWVDRLIRVRHVIDVPGWGEVEAVPFIGPPTAIARSGAEVQVSASDKAWLGFRGARPYTAGKGANAVQAIKSILSVCTGEFRFRFPANARRLSKSYSVGWADEAAPVVVAAKIAEAELGMQLIWSCDGYATLRVLPTSPSADMGYVTEVAQSSVDFSTLANFALVTGGAVSKKVGTSTVTTKAQSTAVVGTGSSIHPNRLMRQGVPRYLPVVITEDGYKKTAQTAARATAEVTKAATVVDEIGASVVPMFHLDCDDVVLVHGSDDYSRSMRLKESSIPFGVTGDQTIGHRAWVSKVAAPRVASKLIRTIKKAKAKKRPRRKRK